MRRPSNDNGGGESPSRPAPPATDRWTVAERAVESKILAVGLAPAYLHELMGRAVVWSVKKDDVVFPEDVRPNVFCFVASGSVEIVVRDEDGRRSIVQIAKPGFVFSPFARPGGRGRVSAVAHEDSIVGTVDRDVVRHVLQQLGPRERLGLFNYMCRALSRLIYDRCRFFGAELPDRVAQQLVDLAQHFSRPDEPGLVDLPLHHQDLADMVGSVRAAVCRSLGTLEESGLVTRSGLYYRVAPALLGRRGMEQGHVAEAAGMRVADDGGGRAALRDVLRTAWRALGSPAEAIAAFGRKAELVDYEAGDVIGTGRKAAVTLLVSGVARVECLMPRGRRVGVRMAVPGQFIGAGWTADDPHRRRRFLAVAIGAVRVARLEIDDMLDVVGAFNADQMLALLGLYSNLLSWQIHDKSVMLPMSTSRRVDYVLRTLADEFPVPHPDGTVIALPLQVKDVAILVGAGRESTNRSLTKLKRDGKLAVVDRRLLLRGYRPLGKGRAPTT
jgi:CRP-like cAMP-binding protein